MAHDKYILHDLGEQVELEPLEHVMGQGSVTAETRSRFMAAMTIRQVADSCRAMRTIGLDPNVWGAEGQVSLIGDHSLLAVVDGQPQYEGAPDVNDDWRVAILVNAGSRLAEFAETMGQLASNAA
jgi:hypothetical protein